VREVREVNYETFLETKLKSNLQTGLETIPELNPMLFDFQKDIVKWALKMGRAAIFADCGMGKTPMQLEWARHIPGEVLIIAPLAVSNQTIREGDKFGIKVERSEDGIKHGHITITNYERMDKFDFAEYSGIVLDESSILKSLSGKYRTELISKCQSIPFRLACTATPAPNDHMELGNHSEFLGVLKRSEMLSMFFVNDCETTQKWRIKGHAKRRFWEWVCEWAVMIKKPSDLGYDDGDFQLPEIRFIEHIIKSEKPLPGQLFEEVAHTMDERRLARRDSVEERSRLVADIVATKPDESWLIWCNLNNEGDTAKNLIPESVQVSGSDDQSFKEKMLLGFATGDPRILISKPKIAGFGMNWQNCHNMIFHGLSDSYEQIYQATRRCWRFGQKSPVDVHIVLTSKEGSILDNIKRKEKDALEMANEMVTNMKDLSAQIIHGEKQKTIKKEMRTESGDRWKMINGDCVDGIKTIESESIGYAIFSPPFAELYTYSDDLRDMGNSKNYDDFFKHFDFLTPEIFRVMQQGRLVSIHCIDIPAMKERDGYIGIKDFPGDLIRQFQKHGFIYHSRVTIWKDPLIEATRTKSLGLMHKQIQKDSSMCRQGLPDYVITFRKPGVNQSMIDHPVGFTQWIGNPEDEPKQDGIRFSHHVWREYASPIWMNINQSRTLQKASAREDNDEKHICPLQLDTIDRCLELWSKEDDIVLSPFAGIGSEGFESVVKGRRFIGIELKESYFRQAVANLKSAVHKSAQQGLFS
jgi:DNA modification methylase/superfamily II DNA or RNA helicase